MNDNINVEIINEISSDDFSSLLTKAVEETLKYEGISTPVDVSITVVDEEEIRVLNAEHRDIDKVTDVLSFPMMELYAIEEKDEVLAANLVNIGYDTCILGDVVLCLDVAKRQANDYGHSLDREVAFLTVHSVLHLLGYDHMNEEDEMQMRAKQREIMDILGLTKEK